jgi:hypothetical protein
MGLVRKIDSQMSRNSKLDIICCLSLFVLMMRNVIDHGIIKTLTIRKREIDKTCYLVVMCSLKDVSEEVSKVVFSKDHLYLGHNNNM